MKNPKKMILLICLLTFVAVIIATKTNHHLAVSSKQNLYYCPMHPTYTSDKPGNCPICNMKLVKRESNDEASHQTTSTTSHSAEEICLMHNCPKMHDGQPCPMMVLAKPGEKVVCPMCGTHIIENDKNAVALLTPTGYASVLITPQKQQLIGMKTAPVEKKKLAKSIRTVGTIAHDPELYQAQAEYIEAIGAYERAKNGTIPEIIDQAKRLVNSSYIRLKHMGLSDEMITEIASWKEPEHGLLFAHAGDPVWVYAQIYEYELSLIHIGQELTAEIPALSGQTFTGKIRAIDPMVDPTTRTTRIRAQIQDPQGQLKPDMYVNVTIAIDLGETTAIPEEAVFDTGTKKIVFVDKGQGLFEPRDVTVGSKADGYYEIKSGVTSGEVVVTNGNFLIDSESRLKSALQGMGQEQGHQHGQ